MTITNPVAGDFYIGVHRHLLRRLPEGHLHRLHHHPELTLAVSPTSLSVAQGASGSTTVTTTVSSGFNSAVAPDGLRRALRRPASFNPTSIAAPGSGSSTLTPSPAAPPGGEHLHRDHHRFRRRIDQDRHMSLTITTGGGGVLTNGVLHRPASAGTWKLADRSVPSGQSVVKTSGGTGDADLYVTRLPRRSPFHDGRSAGSTLGQRETVTTSNPVRPAPGTSCIYTYSAPA